MNLTARKSRMMGLSDGEDSVILAGLVYIRHKTSV